MGLLKGLVRGAAAGAAGTTGLNAVTYLDMAGRGRSSSSAPMDTVEAIADKAPVDVPGDGDTRDNRVTALGSLQGIAVGVGVGAGLGAVRGLGWRPPTAVTAALASVLAMGLTDGTMAVLGVTDPRKWGATDWASDVLPHLAYGLITAATLASAEEGPA